MMRVSTVVSVYVMLMAGDAWAKSFLRTSNDGSRDRELGSPTPDNWIIGGSTASGSDFPFHALLFADSNDDSSYFCGGSLIRSGE